MEWNFDVGFRADIVERWEDTHHHDSPEYFCSA